MIKVANPEGPVSALVLDSAKFQCENCGGSKMYISKTIDDPNDVGGQAEAFTAYDITITGGSFQGLICLCAQCGVQQVPFWYILDIGACTGAAVTMTNLDAGTANTLADLYAIPCCGTDGTAKKYHVIASHTAATPTVITMDTASGDDTEDGYWMITNLLPVGKTLAS